MAGLVTGSTPDLTPEGITALVLGVLTNIYVLFGLNITDAQKGAISGLVTTGILVAFLFHSSIIRKARAANAPAIAQLKADGTLR